MNTNEKARSDYILLVTLIFNVCNISNFLFKILTEFIISSNFDEFIRQFVILGVTNCSSSST